MNKYNLIKLGALAQKQFDMNENFHIMEVSSDNPKRVRVLVPPPIEYPTRFIAGIFDEIELKKFGTQDNFEFIWCAYSRLANTLVIQEIK